MPAVLEMPKHTKTEQPDQIDFAAREREEQEIKMRKDEATFHYKQIKQASVLQSRNSLRIGYHAAALKAKNLWGILGFKDEGEAREAAGVGESTWFSTLRLAEQFKEVPEELFTAMRLTNAKALSDLPESKRQDREWLKAAADDSLKEFQAKVDLEMNGKAKDSDSKEVIRTFKTTMPESQMKTVERGIKEYAVSVGIDPTNTGKVLETMVAEHTGGAGLIETILATVQKVKAAKEVIHSGRSLDEVVEAVEKVLDEVVLDFAAALEQASQRNSEAA
jgi:hypothetical protein